MVDPAKQGDDDQNDDANCHDKQHHPALLAIGPRGPRDDADQAEQERALGRDLNIVREIEDLASN